jgi:hypothetical protein
MVALYALLRRLEEAFNTCNACPKKSCRVPLWIVTNLAHDKHCALGGGQHLDIACNREGSLEPRLMQSKAHCKDLKMDGTYSLG